jgi:hypothetical protein
MPPVHVIARRPLRTALCVGVAYLAVVLTVLFLGLTAATDGTRFSYGFLAMGGGLLGADVLLPGTKLWIGRPRGVRRRIVSLASGVVMVLLALVTLALSHAIGPGWAGPVLLAWFAPAFLGWAVMQAGTDHR